LLDELLDELIDELRADIGAIFIAFTGETKYPQVFQLTLTQRLKPTISGTIERR